MTSNLHQRGRSHSRSISIQLAIAGICLVLLGGSDSKADLILFEDFEDPINQAWAAGGNTFGAAESRFNFSGSPHDGVIDGGSRYGTLVPSLGASPGGGPLIGGVYVIDMDDLLGVASGNATIDFDGWLASETNDQTTSFFSADLFSGTDGSTGPLGRLALAVGSTDVGVVDSVGIDGVLGADWSVDNWSRYITSLPLDQATRSIRLVYGGLGEAFNDRAFADNVRVSLTVTAVPEPGASLLILVVIGCVIAGRRRLADPVHRLRGC